MIKLKDLLNEGHSLRFNHFLMNAKERLKTATKIASVDDYTNLRNNMTDYIKIHYLETHPISGENPEFVNVIYNNPEERALVIKHLKLGKYIK